METVVNESLYDNEIWTKCEELKQEIVDLRLKLRNGYCYEDKEGDKVVRELYNCASCMDVLNCNLDEAVYFRDNYESYRKELIRNNEWKLRQERYFTKLGSFLSSLNIKKRKRRVSVIFDRIKKEYVHPFFSKVKQKLKVNKTCLID